MVEKITKNILKKIIDEVKKDDNQELIELELISPIIKKCREKAYPYVSIIFYMYILNIILMIIILILIVMFNNKK